MARMPPPNFLGVLWWPRNATEFSAHFPFFFPLSLSKLNVKPQAAQAHNTRSYILFFFFTFMRTFGKT